MPNLHWKNDLRRFRSALWRGGLVIIVMTAAMTAFTMGVDVSARGGVPAAGFFTRIYYTLGLFVLGGLDLGVPTGGTSMGRALLWTAYFGAPAITGFAVAEGIIRAVSPDQFRLRKVRNHLIVAGGGPLVTLYLTRLQELNIARTVVLVLEGSTPPPTLPAGIRIILIRGDIRSTPILDSLRLKYAKGVFLAHDDGYTNLDAASQLLTRSQALGKRIIVHVSDLLLLRAIEGTRVERECTIFNSHHIAATHLVHSELIAWFDHTVEDDIVVFGGFGRFGQTVLSELQTHATGMFSKVLIVDPDAENLSDVFDQQVGFNDTYSHQAAIGDIACPKMWHDLESANKLSKHKPAFVLGCGDDATNIRAALQAAHLFPEARILARVFGRSAFAEDLGKDKDIHVISVSELVKASMPAHWFGSRERSEKIHR